MPDAITLLIFDLYDERFGVDATLVRECVWLPQLTPVEEAPPYIAGIFSLRGRIVPVTDLNLRFNHPALPYHLSDQIVVLELDNLLLGLIVNEVIEVITVEGGIGNACLCRPGRPAECGMILQSDSLQSLPAPQASRQAGAFSNQHSAFEIVRVGDALVTLLDASQLMHQPQGLAKTDMERMSPAYHFCPEATPEQHAIFHARASALMEAAAEEQGAYLSLAVVELGGEYFGIELHAVQEFCDIAQPSPIPCCPPHVLGAINLRGNLLTLLDLRAALNLPRASTGSGKVVITRFPSRYGTGEQAVGIAVDQVHDVVYLRVEKLQAAPAALREQHGAEIKSTAPYGDRMMTVLDLPALLAREEWIVNENV